MRLTLKNDETALTFVKESFTETDLQLAYQLFTGKAPKAEEPKKPVPSWAAEIEPLPTIVTETKSRPKTLPFLNSARTLHEPIENAARITRESVKVYVFCPNCGHEGDQTTYRGNRYTKCYGCQDKLFLQPAGENWGDVDEEGYEYHATKEYFESRATE